MQKIDLELNSVDTCTEFDNERRSIAIEMHFKFKGRLNQMSRFGVSAACETDQSRVLGVGGR